MMVLALCPPSALSCVVPDTQGDFLVVVISPGTPVGIGWLLVKIAAFSLTFASPFVGGGSLCSALCLYLFLWDHEVEVAVLELWDGVVTKRVCPP